MAASEGRSAALFVSPPEGAWSRPTAKWGISMGDKWVSRSSGCPCQAELC